MFRSPTKDPAQPTPDAKGPTPPSPAPAPNGAEARAAEAPQPAPAPAPAPQARKPEQTASVLGADLLIKGGIEGRGEIQLQGRAWGDVKVERLIVGDSAELEGSVDAVVVEVRGRVAGSITARQVRLLPTARVEGDITYEQIAIELGAQFEGKCIRSKATAAQSAASGAGAQGKERSNGGAQSAPATPQPAAAAAAESARPAAAPVPDKAGA